MPGKRSRAWRFFFFFRCRKKKGQKKKPLKISMWKQLGKESAISARKRHFPKECPTDMSKVKCFKCDQMGDIEANCKSPKARAKALPKAKPKANTKGSPRKTTKGKGGGKGKKGKLNEEETLKPDEN